MKRSGLTFVFLISTFFVVNAQNSLAAKDTSSKAEITFETLIHDYGTVYQGADGIYEFKFKNTGTDPLILSNVKSSCGCTIPSWPKEPILPGKSGAIKVNYTRMNNPGTISKQVTVYSNAKNGTIILNIKGTILVTPTANSPEKPVNMGSTPVAN